MGTIVEESPTAEISPKTENVEKEKVDDEPDNEPETEHPRVQMSAKAFVKIYFNLHVSQ
jgi:hypothetical protein